MLLQACAKAHSVRDLVNRASHIAAHETQQCPDLFPTRGSVDQLPRAWKVPAHPGPYSGRITTHSGTQVATSSFQPL